MEESSVKVAGVWIESDLAFDEVLDRFGQLVSRPDIRGFMGETAKAKDYTEIQEIVRQTVGPAGLMEFARFPLGAFSQLDPGDEKPRKMMRLLIGNPIIMQSMARHVSEVGSYAPVTLLVFEHDGKVRLKYDRLSSLISPYGSEEATEIARSLDEKIISIMTEVA